MGRRWELVVAAAVVGLGAGGAAQAQTAAATLSPQEIEQMRQELQALRAEEAARQARIDALARQLARVTGEPVIETIPAPAAEVAAKSVAAREGGPSFELKTDPGGSQSGTLPALKPGTYQYICSIPGHEQPGMKGTLTVRLSFSRTPVSGSCVGR